MNEPQPINAMRGRNARPHNENDVPTDTPRFMGTSQSISSSFMGWLWLAGCLSIAAALGLSWLNQTPTEVPSAFAAQTSLEDQPSSSATIAIEKLRVGDRVAGSYSSGELQGETEVDPSTWRCLKLVASSDSEDGEKIVRVETLQPPEWVTLYEPELGNVVPIPLDLVEMGLPAEMQAVVVANDPCPEIRPGLTTIENQSDAVYELEVAAEDGTTESIRTTGGHKFYRESDQAWVSAQTLLPADQLQGASGSLAVSGVSEVPGLHSVFNMTVEGEHVYRVSTLGALVHNNDCDLVTEIGLPDGSKIDLNAPRTIKGSLSRQQVEQFANTYYDTVARGNAYARAGLIDDIGRANGYKLTNNQLRQVRHYFKNEVFDGVNITQKGGRRYVDFGDYAPGRYTISQKHVRQIEQSVSHLTGEAKMRALRKLHEQYLSNKYGVDMTGMTWHHTETVGEFQRVPLGLHKLFSPHDGLVTR